jgi:CubicO group peptidase (beta-lactamase class C family)
MRSIYRETKRHAMSSRLRLCVACLLISVCGAKLSADGVDFPALESIVENGTKTYYGGIGACLFSDRGTLWRYRSGGGDNRIAFDENTEIHIGELSGQFTILAVRALCAQGKIDIDSPVSRYLPELFSGANANVERIGGLKIRSLLAEASGYADRPIPNMDGILDADSLAKRLSGAKNRFPEGVRRSESSLMMDVLGLLVEKASGRSFGDYVRDEVYGPLGMVASSFEKDSTPPEKSRFYHAGGEPFLDSSSDMYNYLDPFFSMRSTLSDLAQCYSYLLRTEDEDQTKEKRAIDSEAPFSPAIAGQLNRQGYESGEGWILTEPSLDYLGSVAWAEGSYLSHRVVVILARNQNVGIVLAGNIYDQWGINALRDIGIKILKRYIEEQFKIPPPSFSRPEVREIPADVSPQPGLYASSQGVAIVGVGNNLVTLQCNGAYSEFAFSTGESFLPTTENEFRELEIIDSASFLIRWNTGTEALMRRPSFTHYSFIVPPREGTYRPDAEASGGWSDFWVIASHGQYFTISGGDMKEYLLLDSSPTTAGILCDDGSVFFGKQVLIDPSGTVSIRSVSSDP